MGKKEVAAKIINLKFMEVGRELTLKAITFIIYNY